MLCNGLRLADSPNCKLTPFQRADTLCRLNGTKGSTVNTAALPGLFPLAFAFKKLVIVISRLLADPSQNFFCITSYENPGYLPMRMQRAQFSHLLPQLRLYVHEPQGYTIMDLLCCA